MDKFNLKIIIDYMNEHNISKTEFCRRCKIDSSVLKKIFNQQFNIRIKSLYAIIKELNIKVKDIFITSKDQ